MTNHIIVDQRTTITQNQRVLVSGVCRNKLPQTGWLTMRHHLLSQVWRPEVRNQGVSRAPLPLRALGENPSWPLPASGGSWCSLASGCITPVSASVLICLLCVLFCPLKSTCHCIEGPQENPGWFHFKIPNLTLSAKDPFHK